MCLLSRINLKSNPNLVRLLRSGESVEDAMKLPPEQLLLRWFNYQLEAAGVSRRVANYGSDLKDCECYVHLLRQIDPNKQATAEVLSDSDLTRRAAHVVKHGRRLGAEFPLQPKDITSANEKLNLAFVAALFNACPALAPLDEQQAALLEEVRARRNHHPPSPPV